VGDLCIIFYLFRDELMGSLVFRYKDWYLLNNQLMECVEEIKITRRNKETHMCGGQPFLVPYLFHEEDRRGNVNHFIVFNFALFKSIFSF
jgi:hypothetical protein